MIGWLQRQKQKLSRRHAFVAVGYPKVGNTWLRLTLGYYLQLRYQLKDLPLMDSGDSQPLLATGASAVGEFTHAPLEWDAQQASDLTEDNVIGPFAGRRVLFLTRYPLDTLVSLFMQQRHRTQHAPFTGSIADFVADPVFGIEKLLRFHQLWARGAAATAGFHLWRYEDALANPRASFEAVLRFLGEPVDEAAVTHAVERSSFENVRALETSGKQPVYKSSNLAIFATGDPSNPNALHTRKGRAGGYRDELPRDLSEALERRISAEMPAMFQYSVPPAGQ